MGETRMHKEGNDMHVSCVPVGRVCLTHVANTPTPVDGYYTIRITTSNHKHTPP